MNSPEEHEVLNNIVKDQSEMEKCDNLCGSEKTETTNDVDDNAPSVSLNYDQMFDLNHENSSYYNSSISDCDVSIYDDFEYNDKIVQEEDSKDSDKTTQNEFLTNDQHANSLNSLTELRENFVSIDSECEKICRAEHGGEKFVDSGISLTMEDDNKIIRQAIDNYDNSQNISKKDNVPVEENITNKKLTQNVTYINIEDSLQGELDIKNISVSTIESNHCFTNNESYFKDDLNLPKHTEENAKHTSSIEEDSIEKTVTKIRKINKIIKNFYASDDEHHDSPEERMIEELFTKMENDHDDVMRKIIESCSYDSADFQQHSPIREISNTDLIRSNSECVIKKSFRGNELFPRRHVASETAIAKEDILRTIEEAEKILTDNPCWDTSETNVNKTTKNYDKNNLLEKTMEKVKDKEQERVNETVNKKEIDFIDNEDTEISSANMVTEKITISECDSDIVESNFQKLAEITRSDRPRSRIEIRETLEKIAEEKKKIEDRKKESLEMLSKKFEEIDELIANHDFAFYLSDNDSCEFKTSEDVTVDSDSLDEFQIDPENFEVPLTKSKITENLKIEELEKELADEMEEHKRLMDEYQKIITTDLEKIQLTLESESTQACNDADIDEEPKNASKDENINEKFSNETSKMMNTTDTTAIKINSEFDEFFTEELKEPEKIYIKGKIYDFDEKKDGIR